jgi:formylglycine-generating enzyme required for sulfatase activity
MDIVGNAAEWVAECSDADAKGAEVPAADCTSPDVRGSSWKAEPADVSATGRARPSTTLRSADVGFRLAMGS